MPSSTWRGIAFAAATRRYAAVYVAARRVHARRSALRREGGAAGRRWQYARGPGVLLRPAAVGAHLVLAAARGERRWRRIAADNRAK